MSAAIADVLEKGEWRLEDYRLFLRRHWAWVLMWAIIGWGLGALIVSRIPDSYQAKTRIIIDRYTTEPVGFVETLPALAARRDIEFLTTEYQLMTSRPVLEQVLKELNLTGFPPFSTSPDPALVLGKMIRVSPVRGTKLVDVFVTATNPRLAMLVVNTTVQVYAQMNLERRRQQTTGGADWLREEVSRAEQKMRQAQAALQQFKEEHQMVSLEDRQNVIVQRLKELSSAATTAKTDRLRAEAGLAEINRALAAGMALDTLAIIQSNETITGLKAQLAEKEAQLSDRQAVYGALHPSIVQGVMELETLRKQLQIEAQKIIEAVRLELDAAKGRELELQQALAEQERLALGLNRLELDYQNLNRNTIASAELYGSLAKRLKELEVAESMQSNNVRAIDEARLPQKPIAPNRVRFVVQGIFLGATVGALSAFLRETLTTTIRMRRDLESLVNLPFLGHVVRVKFARTGRRGRQTLFFIEHPSGVAAEGMRAIRTTLEFLLPEAPVHRLLITSSLPEDGKTFVSANLAIALQELGRKVILIDADMRRPTLYRLFQIPIEPGLSTYLEGQAALEDILHTIPDGHGVTIIPSGAQPKRPADLLASPKMGELLDRLTLSFTYLFIDTPPLLAVADATILSRVVEGAILVARANRTSRDVLMAAHRQITQAPLKFLATVLNDVRPEYDYYYYRRSYSYYSPSQRSKPPPPPTASVPAQ